MWEKACYVYTTTKGAFQFLSGKWVWNGTTAVVDADSYGCAIDALKRGFLNVLYRLINRISSLIRQPDIAFDFVRLTAERQRNKKMNLYPAVLPSLIILRAWAQAAYVQLYWIANYLDTHPFFVVSVLIGNRKYSLIMKKKVIMLIRNHCSYTFSI